jgi:lipid A 3-O-deacylase
MEKYRNIKLLFCGWVFLTLLSVGAVRAGDDHLVGVGLGAAGIVDDRKVFYGSLEYRPPLEFHRIRPWAICEFSDCFFYGAVGMLMDFNLTDNFVFTPSFGAGYYSQENGIRLGDPLEFRSAAELGWRFDRSSRLTVSYGHLSNGGIGSINPGTEFLKITWLVPLGLK